MKVIYGSCAPDIPFACCDIVDASSFGTNQDLRSAVKGGDATPIPEGTEIPPDAVAWCLPNPFLFVVLERMLHARGDQYSVIPLTDIILIRKSDSDKHRKELAAEMRLWIDDVATNQNRKEFLTFADLICCLTLIQTPADVGTLAAAHRMNGDQDRALFYIRTAQNTWGAEFAVEAMAKYTRFLQPLIRKEKRR